MKLWFKKRTWFLLATLILGIAAFFRFYRLADLPPGLYWEEVALGYDAYSILKTGRDHHGHFLPIVAFESFGDYKPALYFYAVVPFIKLFSLSGWAVRLPAALSGLAIVLGLGRLMFLLLDGEKERKKWLSLLAMLITAISPWAILFSRAGWEVNLATALILWGVLFFYDCTVRNRAIQTNSPGFF